MRRTLTRSTSSRHFVVQYRHTSKSNREFSSPWFVLREGWYDQINKSRSKCEAYTATTAAVQWNGLNGRKAQACRSSYMTKSGTGFSSITRLIIGGRCGFQVLDHAVPWVLSRGGPTIRRGRGYPDLIEWLWPPIFLDYLSLSAEVWSAVTLPRDK